MSEDDPLTYFRRAAADSLAAADPTAWFEKVYAAAESGAAVVPWDHHEASPLFVQWAQELDGTGKRAVVVGCGLGENAEFVAALGFATTAFDISATAVAAARRRFPQSLVTYVVADLFEPPASWLPGFDLVVEVATAQALPATVRPRAIAQIAKLVKPGGVLYVEARAADPGAPPKELPPWPLTRAEIESFGTPTLLERVGPHWRAVFSGQPA
ncbi:methyltransferase type 12 [Rhizocola hellebori]|uniref:Methyltransferase type 12 n=1 Tax=Rhizocola hellebori TaxID=1392758 RepID=A0A8J3VJ30_9ACTN|nr:methyltransferase domain-containing protein [Rhizocola hellebori]GIH07588.1 methyltransferase type 12 [Rhizocola hellebori]